MEPSLAAGIEAFNRGDFASAARSFRRAAGRKGAGPEAALFLAQSLRSLGQLPAAAACLEKLVAAHPDYGPAYRGLAEVLQARGLLEQAVAWARRGMRLDPNDAQARAVELGARRELSWSHRKSALAHLKAGRFGASERFLLKALGVLEDKDARDELRKVREQRDEAAREAERRAKRKALLARLSKERRAAARKAADLFAWEREERRKARLARADKARRAERARRKAELARRAKERRAAALEKDRRESAQAARAAERREYELIPRKTCELFLAGRMKDAKAMAARAFALDRARLKSLRDPAERMRALARLGRYDEACALGESVLDAGPTLAQTRLFWNPWGWLPRELFQAGHEAALGSLIGRGLRLPLATYFLAALRGWAEPEEFERLSALPPARYGWMGAWLSQQLLNVSRCEDAVRVARAALGYRPADWSTRFRLAEALICAGREGETLEQAALGAHEAPAEESASALTWQGELHLWLGRYADAFDTLGQACARGETLAWCWRGAAALQLDRLDEGLKLLDAALRLQPVDLEARVWRGEGLRRLGKHEQALRELERAPRGVWRAVNRGLAKAALGDEAGLREEYALIAAPVVRHVAGKLGVEEPANAAEMSRVLEKALELARGYRREDYNQLVWAR